MKSHYQDRKRQRDRSENNYGNKKKSNCYSSRSHSSSSSIDDEVGHFHAASNSSITERYIVVKELGKGTFGKVFKCRDLKHKDNVAIKVVRSIPRYIDSAKIESDILDDIYKKQKAKNTDFCVKMFSRFRFNGHYCLVFEPLGLSLYDLVKMNNYKRLPLDCVKDVTRQMLQAMEFLSSINLIHTDLKMENVLFVHNTLEQVAVDHKDKEFLVSVPVNRRIKLIDFGGATYDDDPRKSTIINTRQYRGPEVTLEVGWSFPSDIWSVGCMVAEIYCGDLLFQTHEELEHLALMEHTLENFPVHMTRRSPHDRKFFHSDGSVRVEELDRDSQKFLQRCPRLPEFFSLSPGDVKSGIVELVRRLLAIDPHKRASATEALRHPFLCSSRPSGISSDDNYTVESSDSRQPRHSC